jgi:hypothetical protein
VIAPVRYARRAAAAAVLVSGALGPAPALACTWCVSSAFGDRSFNWPYLGLILAPFVVAGVIAAVLANAAGFSPRALLRPLVRRPAAMGGAGSPGEPHHLGVPDKETT